MSASISSHNAQIARQRTARTDDMRTAGRVELARDGFERKFLVPVDRSDALRDELSRWLSPDTHAGPDARYLVTSLYLDTPDRAAARGETSGKWRIRRYGDSPMLFAEFKDKPQPNRVVKHRTEFPLDHIAKLAHADGPVPWFAKTIQEKLLFPTRRIAYTRHALVGDIGKTPVRVTLDRDIRSVTSRAFAVPVGADGGELLCDSHLLEVKFAGEMPAPLTELLERLALSPLSISKYRRAMGAAG